MLEDDCGDGDWLWWETRLDALRATPLKCGGACGGAENRPRSVSTQSSSPTSSTAPAQHSSTYTHSTLGWLGILVGSIRAKNRVYIFFPLFSLSAVCVPSTIAVGTAQPGPERPEEHQRSTFDGSLFALPNFPLVRLRSLILRNGDRQAIHGQAAKKSVNLLQSFDAPTQEPVRVSVSFSLFPQTKLNPQHFKTGARNDMITT